MGGLGWNIISIRCILCCIDNKDLKIEIKYIIEYNIIIYIMIIINIAPQPLFS